MRASKSGTSVKVVILPLLAGLLRKSSGGRQTVCEQELLNLTLEVENKFTNQRYASQIVQTPHSSAKKKVLNFTSKSTDQLQI